MSSSLGYFLLNRSAESRPFLPAPLRGSMLCLWPKVAHAPQGLPQVKRKKKPERKSFRPSPEPFVVRADELESNRAICRQFPRRQPAISVRVALQRSALQPTQRHELRRRDMTLDARRPEHDPLDVIHRPTNDRIFITHFLPPRKNCCRRARVGRGPFRRFAPSAGKRI